jgi:16S rRNA (guanine527-N7)-methyltransferase
MTTLWDDLFAAAGVALDHSPRQSLSRYLDLLSAANQRMNLTRITERSAMELQHIADALTLLPFLPKESHRLADIGSGGGVPGIPLAIARPDARVTLIESTKKKAAFLRKAVAELRLVNVEVIDERVEDVGRAATRETFDVAVVRAVAQMVWLVEWGLPLLRIGGKLLAMKGQKVSDELSAAAKAGKLLGGRAPIVHPVVLPGTDHHVIVEVTKQKKTDARFPRPPTAAKGKPLF